MPVPQRLNCQQKPLSANISVRANDSVGKFWVFVKDLLPGNQGQSSTGKMPVPQDLLEMSTDLMLALNALGLL